MINMHKKLKKDFKDHLLPLNKQLNKAENRIVYFRYKHKIFFKL